MRALIFLLSVLLITACEKGKKKLPGMITDPGTQEAITVLKTNCYACHNPNSKSHDDIIAPPLAGIKMRYQMQHNTKEEFVNRMTTFILDPKEETSLMMGAVARFKVMPKNMITEEQARIVAAYIYEYDPEEPGWFKEHYEEEHGKMDEN